MKVKELIERLQTVDSELVVCVADWDQQYALPQELADYEIAVSKSKHWERTGKVKNTDYLCIGYYKGLDKK